jgi:hypothetical protein
VEHRFRIDPDQDPLLVRLSIGVEEVGVSLSVAYWFCRGRKLTSTLGPERRLTKGAGGDIERKLDIETAEQYIGNVTSTRKARIIRR